MASKWLSSPLARLAFLTGGTVLLTLGISRDENEWLWIGGFLIALAIYLFYSSQKQLREKSWLMLEAIRNRDYSFRLPTHGFIGGERIMQNALNEFGAMMGEQKQLMEQRERFYEQVLSGISSGIIVLDEQNKIIQTNPAATRLLGLPPSVPCNNWSVMGMTYLNYSARFLPVNGATCNTLPPKGKSNC